MLEHALGNGIISLMVTSLYASIKSPLLLLLASLVSPHFSYLSVNVLKSLIILAAFLCTLPGTSLSFYK